MTFNYFLVLFYISNECFELLIKDTLRGSLTEDQSEELKQHQTLGNGKERHRKTK